MLLRQRPMLKASSKRITSTIALQKRYASHLNWVKFQIRLGFRTKTEEGYLQKCKWRWASWNLAGWRHFWCDRRHNLSTRDPWGHTGNIPVVNLNGDTWWVLVNIMIVMLFLRAIARTGCIRSHLHQGIPVQSWGDVTGQLSNMPWSECRNSSSRPVAYSYDFELACKLLGSTYMCEVAMERTQNSFVLNVVWVRF